MTLVYPIGVCAMPLYLRHYNLFLWIALSWVSCKVISADITKYGMRIRPLPTVPTVLRHSSCTTCSNQTSGTSSGIHRTKSALDLQTNIKQESSDAKGTVKESSFKYRNFYHTLRPLVKNQQTTSPSYSDLPKDNPQRGATFFFTQVEPHRFEYRAMFQHERNQQSNLFQPFVHDFDAFSKEFPPLPNFPSFPQFPEPKDGFPNFFSGHKDPFPNFNAYSFPTLPPSIKRSWHPTSEVNLPAKEINLPRTMLDEKFEGPLVKNYDVVLGHMQYPKIFRFNEERVNIEDFDRQKKIRFYNLSKKEQNELLEPENVKRDQLLILHGGIFTVQEPPLFNKNKHPKKRRKSGGFGSYRQRL